MDLINPVKGQIKGYIYDNNENLSNNGKEELFGSYSIHKNKCYLVLYWINSEKEVIFMVNYGEFDKLCEGEYVDYRYSSNKHYKFELELVGNSNILNSFNNKYFDENYLPVYNDCETLNKWGTSKTEFLVSTEGQIIGIEKSGVNVDIKTQQLIWGS